MVERRDRERGDAVATVPTEWVCQICGEPVRVAEQARRLSPLPGKRREVLSTRTITGHLRTAAASRLGGHHA